MANKKRTPKSPRKPKQKLKRKIKSESSSFLRTDSHKVMLEIMCDLMIKDLGAILSQIQVETNKPHKLSNYVDLKQLMTRILISNKQMNVDQRKLFQFELVRDFFKLLLATQQKKKELAILKILFIFLNI